MRAGLFICVLLLASLFLTNIVKADDIREIYDTSVYNSAYLVRANYPTASGWYQAVSQSFMPTVTANLSSIDFMLFKMGTPDFTINVELRGISGSYIGGTAYPNATVLATSANFDETRISTYFRVYRFYFDGTYEVNNATAYCAIFYLTGGTADGDGYQVVVGANDKTGNCARYFSGAWSTNTIDLFFRVNGIVPETEALGEYTDEDMDSSLVGGIVLGAICVAVFLIVMERKR